MPPGKGAKFQRRILMEKLMYIEIKYADEDPIIQCYYCGITIKPESLDPSKVIEQLSKAQHYSHCPYH